MDCRVKPGNDLLPAGGRPLFMMESSSARTVRILYLPSYSNPRYLLGSNPERTLADLANPVLATAAERLAAVRREIAAACGEAKRDPSSVTLVAISKTFGAEAIAPVIAGGQAVFGENRVQEARAKWPAL